MKVIEIGEARKHRVAVRAQYDTTPLDAMFDEVEASWRAAWADHCARTGEIVPFNEWFYESKSLEIVDGVEGLYTPFDVAGWGPTAAGARPMNKARYRQYLQSIAWSK
jgi:hypothetical protein